MHEWILWIQRRASPLYSTGNETEVLPSPVLTETKEVPVMRRHSTPKHIKGHNHLIVRYRFMIGEKHMTYRDFKEVMDWKQGCNISDTVICRLCREFAAENHQYNSGMRGNGNVDKQRLFVGQSYRYTNQHMQVSIPALSCGSDRIGGSVRRMVI